MERIIQRKEEHCRHQGHEGGKAEREASGKPDDNIAARLVVLYSRERSLCFVLVYFYIPFDFNTLNKKVKTTKQGFFLLITYQRTLN